MTRDRKDEMTVYISKKHHARLKRIAKDEGRTMRVVLERWIDSNTPNTILKQST